MTLSRTSQGAGADRSLFAADEVGTAFRLDHWHEPDATSFHTGLEESAENEAWFNDSEGNLLTVAQPASSST
jgi:hypothetical protein